VAAHQGVAPRTPGPLIVRVAGSLLRKPSNPWNLGAGNNPVWSDPPPLKWSDLRYVFDIKEDCNGKEAIQA